MTKIYHAHLLPGITPGVFYAVEENYQEDAADLDSFMQTELEELNRSGDSLWVITEGITVAGIPDVPFRIVRGMYPDLEIWLAFYAKEE